jgi:hypothetical protein
MSSSTGVCVSVTIIDRAAGCALIRPGEGEGKGLLTVVNGD